jgi:hypothetical protein
MNEFRSGVLGRRAGPFADLSAPKLVQPPKELSMDMNELFYHHQMALMAVGQTRGASARHADFDLPGHYAKRIDDYRARRGMRKYFAGSPLPDTAAITDA